MEKFAESGVEGLVIERMSSELGCSKSSFYWYFKNRDEYIARLVQRWSDITTQQVIRHSSGSETAEEQLRTMLSQMFSATQKGDFLFYLRRLSKEYPSFQAMLEKIELTRMKYAQELFMKLGMAPEMAEQKSHILYHYYLGWYERHKHDQIEVEHLNRHIEMLQEQLLGI